MLHAACAVLLRATVLRVLRIRIRHIFRAPHAFSCYVLHATSYLNGTAYKDWDLGYEPGLLILFLGWFWATGY
jgi:hypothetical protein